MLEELEAQGIVVDVELAPLAREMPAAATPRSREPAGRRRRGPRRVLRRTAQKLSHGKLGRRLILSLLDDPRTLSWILHRLSNRSSARASFEGRLETAPARIDGFEDCVWLLSANPLDHGLARLELDEAAYLFRLARSLREPITGEIGRLRGGTTFLLAAAGAHVISVDNDLEGQGRFSLELAAALKRYGLSDRVEIVVGDSHSYPLDAEAFDLVFFDGDHSYAAVRADFEHWWPAVAPGGHLVFHDASFAPTDSRVSVTEGVARLVDELDTERIAERRRATGSLAHFVKPQRQ